VVRVPPNCGTRTAKQLYLQVSIKYLEIKEQIISKTVTHEQQLILTTAGNFVQLIPTVDQFFQIQLF
jgi:hypothetical protein